MNITVKDLLDAGVHFGHQLRRYNPRAKKFVFGSRHGISIIDLEKTYEQLEKATAFAEQIVGEGKKILFVGTKRQAQEVVREGATSCQMPFCANRWLGGTLTNFVTIKNSISKYKRYLAMEADGSLAKMHKKEGAAVRREMTRMRNNFEGMLEMEDLPGALFAIDTRNEAIAVAEANRLHIPVIGLVDTNADPSVVQHPIPGNDDSIKSIRIIMESIVDGIQEGLARQMEAQQASGTPRPIAAAISRESITEEQLPVTQRRRRTEGETEGEPSDDIPESFSTDD